MCAIGSGSQSGVGSPQRMSIGGGTVLGSATPAAGIDARRTLLGGGQVGTPRDMDRLKRDYERDRQARWAAGFQGRNTS